MKVLALSSADVLASSSMASAIGAVREAFWLRAKRRISAPLRTRIELTGTKNFLVMAAMIRTGWNPVTVKLVNVDSDPAAGAGAVDAKVFLLGGKDGEAKAVMDGGALTALRTGAVSGLSCRYLARRDARLLGIIGAGGQAFHQISGVCAERRIAKVKIFSRHRGRSASLATRVGRELCIDAHVSTSAAACAAGSDVVVTATTSPTPVLTRSMVDDGTHVIAVGAYTPETREVDTSLVRAALVFADSEEAVMAEAGDFLIPLKEGKIRRSHLKGDLAGLVSGKTKGRRSDGDVTLFKSLGLAFEDTAVARLVYDRAIRTNRGRWVELW
ncbi:MAG: hypothetical protein JRN24_00345 [Nitrososphaerota archaeon]|nr:hypothetical protein [Nitrososphaerota archaeon]